jgi:YidC/Oxa1 family membrane protein insertase
MREILATPFGWALSGLYNLFNQIGVDTFSYILAIVLITVFVKLVLLPASVSQQKNSAKQVRLNTKVNKIKQKYAGNQQKIQEETQALYQREGFGAANMGCLPLMAQLIVMMGLYGVIYAPVTHVLQFSKDKIEILKTALNITIDSKSKRSNGVEFEILGKIEEGMAAIEGIDASEMAELVQLKDNFVLNIGNLELNLLDKPEYKEPSILWAIPILAFLTAMMSSVFMYFKQRKQNPQMANNPTMGCMTFMSPVMSLIFTFMFPAGVGVYWIISNIFAFVQQVFLTYFYSPKKVIAQQMVDETVVRRSKENNTKRRVDIEKK